MANSMIVNEVEAKIELSPIVKQYLVSGGNATIKK